MGLDGKSLGKKRTSQNREKVTCIWLVVSFRVEELMLSLDESSDTLNKNLKEKEKENRNLERR